MITGDRAALVACDDGLALTRRFCQGAGGGCDLERPGKSGKRSSRSAPDADPMPSCYRRDNHQAF